jgi:hypothetical protein
MNSISPVKRHAYLRDDLAAKLAAIEYAVTCASRASYGANPDYARGFADAVTAMRVALELTIVQPVEVDA